MKKGRFWIGFVGVFGFLFIFEWLVHGVFLKGLYAQTPQVWRTEADMMSHFPWFAISLILFAFIFCLVFTKGYENRGTAEGARYGFLIGALFTPMNLGWYAMLPISITLVFAWIVTVLVEFTLAGIILPVIYKPPEAVAKPSPSSDETQPLP